jgi:hypothetical protein
MGTPPPLPRGAFVSFPFASYNFFSLPLVDTSDTDAVPPVEDCGGRVSDELLEYNAVSRGPLVLSLVPLLREVVRLEAVSVRVIPFLGLSSLGVARQSANPSRRSWIVSVALVLPTFFSFFSTSFAWTLRLRAPLADIADQPIDDQPLL